MNKLNQRTNRLYSISDHAITLIALIVTIIIILILAGVTINLAVNSNLFDKAKKATGAYKNTSGDEQTWINEADKEIAKYMPGETPEGGSESGSGSSKDPQEVNDDLVANHEKYYNEAVSAGQSSDKKDVGLDKDGKVVNLSKWYYIKTENGKGMSLGDANDLNASCMGHKAYLGELVAGKVPDKMPEYIYIDSENKVYPVIELDNMVGYSSENLTVVPDIPATITKMYETFDKCIKLTSITIPNSITSIGDYVFYSCEGLTSITIPNSVTSIGIKAFGICSSLTSITIPDSVTSIGHDGFYGCKKLTSITYLGTKQQWNSITKGEDWNDSTGNYVITCTDGEITK